MTPVRSLRKCVALNPICGDPPCAEGDYRHPSVPRLYDATNTDAIRFWADWASLQPTNQTTFDLSQLRALDENIARARSGRFLTGFTSDGTPITAPIMVPVLDAKGKPVLDAQGNPVTKAVKRITRIGLSTRRYPLWVNGTQDLVYRPDEAPTPQQVGTLKQPKDPCVQAMGVDRPSLLDGTRPGETLVADHAAIELSFRFPGPGCGNLDDIRVGDQSSWYWWILFLAARYAPPPKPGQKPNSPYAATMATARPAETFVDYLEFVNEPNGPEGWPQLNRAGDPLAPSVVARMFQTAWLIRYRDLASARGPLMAGPALADRYGGQGRRSSGCHLFTDDLLQALARMRFGYRGATKFARTGNFVWTHHNYGDCTTMFPDKSTTVRLAAPQANGKRNPQTPARTNAAALIRNKLHASGWRGWMNPRADSPRLFLTEGGVVRTMIERRRGESDEQLRVRRDRVQADRLKQLWEAMRDEAGLGRGVAMFTQFLFYQQFASSEFHKPKVQGEKIFYFDTGLLQPLQLDGNDFRGKPLIGIPRPAYRVWGGLDPRKTK